MAPAIRWARAPRGSTPRSNLHHHARAREPHIDPAVREDHLATARAQGFDLATLIDTPQDGA